MAALINVSDVLIQSTTPRVLDNSLTREEKPSYITLYAAILAKQTILDSSAVKYGIVAEKNIYDTAITNLTTYLNTLTTPVAWNNVTNQTIIDRDVFNQKFDDVKAAETVLELLTTDKYGVTTAIVYAYQRSLTTPSLLPGNITFEFSSASITVPSGDALANGWTKTIPAGTNPLYVSVASASASASTDTIANAEWATPVKLAENGTSGLSVATVFIYQRNTVATPPTLPSATATYTFATGVTTGLNNGWTTAVPTSGGSYLYVSTATAASTTATDTIISSEWATASLMAQNGTNGSNGSDGSNGTRGSVTVAGSGYTSWSDSSAASVLASYGYGSPINFDIVTLYSSSFSQTKYYSFGSWLVLSAYINGNLLVSGTLSASVISGGLLQGVTIDIGSGQFSVGSNGVVNAYGFFGHTSSFGNLNNPTLPAIRATTQSQSTPCITANNGMITAGAPPSTDCQIIGHGTNSRHGVRGSNNTNGAKGLIAGLNNYDFYADGSGTNYGPFTGAHDVLLNNGYTVEIGDIIVDKVCISRRGISNTIFNVEKSQLANERGVVGVIATIIGSLSEHKPSALISHDDEQGNTIMAEIYNSISNSYTLAGANALGEGQVNVCGKNGNIEVGDLIVSSSIPGKGMKQDDDIIRSYTVAKAREAITFDSPTEIKQIACIYLCG